MPTTYTITTDNPNLYQKMLALSLDPAAGAPGGNPSAPPPAVTQAPPAPPPPATSAPPPPPATSAPPPAAPAAPPASTPSYDFGVIGAPDPAGAPPGWDLNVHIKPALVACASDPSKGPAWVQALIRAHGAESLTALNPGHWVSVYNKATGAA